MGKNTYKLSFREKWNTFTKQVLKVLRFFLSTLVVLLIIFGIPILVAFLLSKPTSVKSIEVNAVVTDMHYEAPYSTTVPISMGKFSTRTLVSHPERYDVTVACNDITETFNNKDLYNAVKVGDYVTVIYQETAYGFGTITKKSLELGVE